MTTDTMDPEIKAFSDQISAAWAQHPAIETLPFPEARRVAELVRAPLREGGPAMLETHDHTFEGGPVPLRYRVHIPPNARTDAALVYMHGGGFTLFSIDSHDRLMREYAAAASIPVIGLDYALSPEFRFPVALEQIVAFVQATHRLPPFMDLAPDIVLGGDSAGANLALAAALRLRDRGEDSRLRALLLNYGAFSPATTDEAEERLGGPGAVLNRAELGYFWGNYLSSSEDATNPLANLLRANLEGLPPSLLVVPDLDVLSEQSFAMADKLGDRAEVRVYRGAIHSFLEAMATSRLARQAIAETSEWLTRILNAAPQT